MVVVVVVCSVQSTIPAVMHSLPSKWFSQLLQGFAYSWQSLVL